MKTSKIKELVRGIFPSSSKKGTSTPARPSADANVLERNGMVFSEFVPRHVLSFCKENLSKLPEAAVRRSVHSAFLFVDISGFTSMCEKFAKEGGTAGCEQFSCVVNDLFGKVLAVVDKWGGDVDCFAGDALLVAFDCTPTLTLLEVALTAARCGLELVKQVSPFRPSGTDICLRLHCALTCGQAFCVYVGGSSQRREWFYCGEPLRQLQSAISLSEPGECVMSCEVWNVVHEYVDAEERGNGFLLSKIQEDAVVQLCTTTSSSRSSGDAHWSKEALSEIGGALAEFMPSIVSRHAFVGHLDYLGHHRIITITFVRFRTIDGQVLTVQDDKVLQGVQTAITIFFERIKFYKGSIRQVTYDDKGLVLIYAFGLQGQSQEDNAWRSLTAFVEAKKALNSRVGEVNINCSAGIATGTVYCGLVGFRGLRCEYACVGDAVNFAARLASKATELHEDILCCPFTHESILRETPDYFPVIPFRYYDNINLKGKQLTAGIFALSTDGITTTTAKGFVRNNSNSNNVISPVSSCIDLTGGIGNNLSNTHVIALDSALAFSSCSPKSLAAAAASSKGGGLPSKLHPFQKKMLSKISPAPVGRETEILEILGLYQSMCEFVNGCAGSGKVVIVEGKTGAGKSQLLQHVCSVIRHQRKGRVFLKCANPEEGSTPYFVWHSLLKSVIKQMRTESSDPLDIVTSMLEDQGCLESGAFLCHVFPWLWVGKSSRQPTHHGLENTQSEKVLELTTNTIVQLIRALSSTSPLVFALEDLEYMDLASWNVLHSLVTDYPEGLLVLASCHEEALDASAADNDDLAAMHQRAARCSGRWQSASQLSQVLSFPCTRMMVLGPLTVADFEALAKETLDFEIPSSVTSELARRAEGNPLIFREMLFNLSQKTVGSPPRGSSEWSGMEGGGFAPAPRSLSQTLEEIPMSISGLITSRMDKLPTQVSFTLQVASVIGRVFDEMTIREVHPLSPSLETLRSELRELELAHFVSRITGSGYQGNSFGNLLLPSSLDDFGESTPRSLRRRGSVSSPHERNRLFWGRRASESASSMDVTLICNRDSSSNNNNTNNNNNNNNNNNSNSNNSSDKESPTAQSPQTPKEMTLADWKVKLSPQSSLSSSSPRGSLSSWRNAESSKLGNLDICDSPVGLQYGGSLLEEGSFTDAMQRMNRGKVYGFCHGLYREVAYESMLYSRRADMHKAAAKQLESAFTKAAELPMHYSILAHHWGCAIKCASKCARQLSVDDIRQAVQFHIAAARQAFDQGLPEQGTMLTNEAIEFIRMQPECTERDQMEMSLRAQFLGQQQREMGFNSTQVYNAILSCLQLSHEHHPGFLEPQIRVYLAYCFYCFLVPEKYNDGLKSVEQLRRLENDSPDGTCLIPMEIVSCTATYDIAQGQDLGDTLHMMESTLKNWETDGKKEPLCLGPFHTVSYLHSLCILLAAAVADEPKKKLHFQQALACLDQRSNIGLPGENIREDYNTANVYLMLALCEFAFAERESLPRAVDIQVECLDFVQNRSELLSLPFLADRLSFVQAAAGLCQELCDLSFDIQGSDVESLFNTLRNVRRESSFVLYRLIESRLCHLFQRWDTMSEILAEWKLDMDAGYLAFAGEWHLYKALSIRNNSNLDVCVADCYAGIDIAKKQGSVVQEKRIRESLKSIENNINNSNSNNNNNNNNHNNNNLISLSPSSSSSSLSSASQSCQLVT